MSLNNILLNRGELANLSTDRLKQFFEVSPWTSSGIIPIIDFESSLDRYMSLLNRAFSAFSNAVSSNVFKILICFAIHEVDTVVSPPFRVYWSLQTCQPSYCCL